MKIVARSKIWLSLSVFLVLISLFFLGLNYIKNGSVLKYGIDFTGGTLIELSLTDNTKTRDDLKNVLTDYQDLHPSVQNTKQGTYILKMKNITNEEYDDLMQSLKTNLGEINEKRFITIGSSVGEVMKKKAFQALIIALIAIVFYIAYAFREVGKTLSPWKFGFSAIIALAHDVIIITGIFAALGYFINLEVDVLFITALLTVMGFSVHDTIVVFDRLRENTKYARPTETFAEVAEKSVNQTIRRSINTSVSTLFPLLALYVWGADSIEWFLFALILGILVGTYSSIFLATPFLVFWQKD